MASTAVAVAYLGMKTSATDFAPATYLLSALSHVCHNRQFRISGRCNHPTE
jgi:hypothetical protein